MIKIIRRNIPRTFCAGQSMVEYILVFVGVVVVLMVAIGPGGILTNKIDQSLNAAVQGSKCMALAECFDPGGCLPVCGDGCCESGESCGADCG